MAVINSMASTAAYAQSVASKVRYERDVAPILAQHCFPCHGPDRAARQASLRLDVRTAAIEQRENGAALVPGESGKSLIWQRVTSDDDDTRMPPLESGKKLNAEQREILRRWIDEGGVYEQHWAFRPLIRSQVPDRLEEGKNPIDAFVAAALAERGWTFAKEAPPETLLRRVTLDLTGLPPTREELLNLRQELQEPGADHDAIYERIVDRLLQSPRFGEHLAVAWLDAARFADTNGYFSDKPRQMWLWRDWVIDALNANMPFDQFTMEQLAGDLLPSATLRQKIATGFNRNHMANNETGSIDEEFRVEYVVDRVHTTMTTWMGLTAGCAQCHDHKYDPISQREFYQLFAFFNNIAETGLITNDDPPPRIEVVTEEQTSRLTELREQVRQADDAFAPRRQQIESTLADWQANKPLESLESLLSSTRANDGKRTSGQAGESTSHLFYESFSGQLAPSVTPRGTTLVYESGVLGQCAQFDGTRHVEAPLQGFDPDGAWTISLWMQPDGQLSCPLSLIQPDGDRRGIEVLFGKGMVTVHLVHSWGVNAIELTTIEAIPSKQWHQLVVAYDGSGSAQGLRIFVNGKRAATRVIRDNLSGSMRNGEPVRIGRRDEGLGFYGRMDEVRIMAGAAGEIEANHRYWHDRVHGILNIPAHDRSAKDRESLLEFYLSEANERSNCTGAQKGDSNQTAERERREAREMLDRCKAARNAEQQYRKSIPTALVMQELPEPRAARILVRGQYDQPGELVEPGVPAALGNGLQYEPKNRLGLARWLMAAGNPLTARVAVNRLWRHCFGEGLVTTVEDFGIQGERPSHPELLDWLAATYRDRGWDLKRLMRLLVTSRVYRQESGERGPAEAVLGQAAPLDADPANRWLARGPRGRMSAEMIRDQALAVSGLMVNRVGGPSVKPLQPPGLWEEVSYNAEDSYVPDAGADLWRRSLYSYIKRQSPPPWLLTFDAPTREKCTVRRQATNTPLQALVLLNDETFVAAARAIAERLMHIETDDRRRMQFLWQTVLTRDADDEELEIMLGLLTRQCERFCDDPKSADAFLGMAAYAPSGRHESPQQRCERAAWSFIAHSMLNLDEAISKR